MGRPAISAEVTGKHLSRAEKAAKTEAEKNLRGRADRIRPPSYLTANQKKIFRYIVSELHESDILGNLDVYVLAECSVAIDRLQYTENEINSNPELLKNSAFMSSVDKYFKIFARCCNELCLSPQARAKMGNININAENENPLLRLIGDDDE